MAQSTIQLSYPRFKAFDSNGALLAGGKLYHYAAGTSDLLDVYTDQAKSSTHPQPIILDSNGEASVWFDAPAKFVLKDSSDVTIWTEDNVQPGVTAAFSGAFNAVLNGSFEIDTDGDGSPDNWDIVPFDFATSTYTTDATQSVNGAQSMKFGSTGLGGGWAFGDYTPCTAGATYDVIFSIQSSVVDVRNVVEVFWYDKDQSYISVTTLYDDSTTNPTSWTKKQYAITAPATAKFLRIKLTGCHNSDSTVGNTWFDDVQALYIPTDNGASQLLRLDSGGGIEGQTYFNKQNAANGVAMLDGSTLLPVTICNSYNVGGGALGADATSLTVSGLAVSGDVYIEVVGSVGTSGGAGTGTFQLEVNGITTSTYYYSYQRLLHSGTRNDVVGGPTGNFVVGSVRYGTTNDSEFVVKILLKKNTITNKYLCFAASSAFGGDALAMNSDVCAGHLTTAIAGNITSLKFKHTSINMRSGTSMTVYKVL